MFIKCHSNAQVQYTLEGIMRDTLSICISVHIPKRHKLKIAQVDDEITTITFFIYEHPSPKELKMH